MKNIYLLWVIAGLAVTSSVQKQVLSQASLGKYEFEGVCPTEILTVTSQPQNGTFSSFQRTGVTANCLNYVHRSENWSLTSSYDPSKHASFTLTANNNNYLYFSAADYILFSAKVSVDNGANDFVKAEYSIDGGPLVYLGEFPLNATLTPLTAYFPSAVGSVINGSIEFRFTAKGCSSSVTKVPFNDVELTGIICTGPVISSMPSGPFYAGDVLVINFSSCAVYNGGNIFTSQLSDATGSFASPAVIGTLSSVSSGLINAILPSVLTAGTGYRIRVISSNPSQTGSDNGADITIATHAIYTVTNTNDAGAGSLRQAVLDANAKPGHDTIKFNIPGSGDKEIEIATQLPDLTDNFGCTINGYSQPGAQANTNLTGGLNGTLLIVLRDYGILIFDYGLVISSDNNIIKGLVFTGFSNSTMSGTCIQIYGANNEILGCYIGTDYTGTQRGESWPEANICRYGINIGGMSNVIGDGTAAGRNLISALHAGYGVGVATNGIWPYYGSDNIIRNNIIGLKKDGVTSFTTGTRYGIESYHPGTIGPNSGGNLIADNLISGNGSMTGPMYGCGIYFIGNYPNRGDTVRNNIIGLQVDGKSLVSSHMQSWGIVLMGQYHIIENNIISGHTASGSIIPCGIRMRGASAGNVIRTNKIGTDFNGACITGSSQQYGILIEGTSGNSDNNIIGGYSGTGTAEGNIIACNSLDGIIVGSLGASARYDLISRNLIYDNGSAYKAINLNAQGNSNYNKPNTMSATAWSVSGKAGSGDSVEVFRSLTADANCNQMREYLGTTIADGSGNWTLSGLSLGTGQVIKATARNANNNTSECGCTTVGLPVEWIILSAFVLWDSPAGRPEVLIKWVTYSEQNNASFTVEKSRDGTNFFPVDSIEGSPDSEETKYYSLKDIDPFHGRSYYRIRQNDLDGGFTITPNVEVFIVSEDQLEILNLYPNPASDRFTLSFSVPDAYDSILCEIFNPAGEKFFSKYLHVNAYQISNQEFHVEDLSPGLYFLKIKAGTRQRALSFSIVR